jgi:hypothetical protein
MFETRGAPLMAGILGFSGRAGKRKMGITCMRVVHE